MILSYVGYFNKTKPLVLTLLGTLLLLSCFPRAFYSVHVLDFLQEVIVEGRFCGRTDPRSKQSCILQDILVIMGSAADDKKYLPPPGIVNRNSVWLAGIGWVTAVLHNAINHRPPLKAG